MDTIVSFLFKKIPNYLLKWLNHFAFQPVMCESLFCSAFLPASGSVSVLNFGHSDCCIAVFHRISLHLFIYILGHLYIFCVEVAVKVFDPFFNQIVCFRIVVLKEFLQLNSKNF